MGGASDDMGGSSDDRGGASGDKIGCGDRGLDAGSSSSGERGTVVASESGNLPSSTSLTGSPRHFFMGLSSSVIHKIHE